MVIYKITNKINNKVYIGKDTQNKNSYFGSGILIKRAIEKYGKDNFSKEIVEVCENNTHLSEREIFWIKEYKSTDLTIGYNLTEGGDGGDTITNHPNKKEICEKISNNGNKGKTYEMCFGLEKAKEYKQKLSENHPRLSPKELNGDNYDKWLESVRKVAKSKKGKSIKSINNWTDDEYENYLISLKARGSKIWDNIDEEDKEKIRILNKERAEKRRDENIKDFINVLNNGGINKDNYSKYRNKIWYWKRDLSEEDFNEKLSSNILEKFNSLKKEFVDYNIKIRAEKYKGNKHTKESKELIGSLLKERKKNDFIKYFKPIKDIIESKNIKQLEEHYSEEESIIIRKKILCSKYRYIAKDYINIIKKVKKETTKSYKKVVKEQSENFHGNVSKKIKIDGVIFESISEASLNLDTNRATIRYRLKNNKSGYEYV